MLSDQVTTESDDNLNGGPLGSILSRTSVGEGDDEMSSEGAGLTGVRSTATASGGEVVACDLGRGADAEDSGVESSIVLAEVSILPSVA